MKVQDPNNIFGLKIHMSSVPQLNKNKFSQILVEPGNKYTRSSFSIKRCGIIWRMTQKAKIQTFAGKIYLNVLLTVMEPKETTL